MSQLVSPVRELSRERWNARAVIPMMVLALAAVIAIKLLWIRTGVLDAMSTDDVMRLVEVRDLMNGQGWFDLHQYRLGPPGVLMHWSRLVDLPLAVSIVLLKPLIGTHGAESVTVFLWPLLLFAGAVALVVAIARHMSNGSAICQISAAVLAALALSALAHFRPGAIDHHNVQIDLLLALILCAQQIERSAIKAALAGVAASLLLAIGVEMLPAVATICVAVAGLFVWRGASVARPVEAFAVALTASSLVLALALLPLQGLASPVCDAWGGPILLLTVGGGIGLMVMAGVDRYHAALWLRTTAAAGSAVALTGAFVWLFEGCLTSPYAQLDPLVISLWLDQVQETVSLERMLRLSPALVPGFYAFPSIALGIAAAALIRSNPAERFHWVVGIVALAALFAVSIWEVRGAGGAAIVGAPMFAAAVTVLWPSLAMGRNLALLAFAVSPLVFATLGLAVEPLVQAFVESEHVNVVPEAARCQSLSVVAPLKDLPKGRMMATIDLGPAILAETDHEVFAAPYHRNNDGNLAMLKLMVAQPASAEQMLRDLHVDYVVVCQTDPNMKIIENAPEGMEARLTRGDAPDFLERIDAASIGNIATWRVRRVRASAR